MDTTQRTPDNLLAGIAFLTFVAIGLNAGLMGVAWPSLRDTFGVGDDALGTITLISTLGSLALTFRSGALVYRFGIGPLLLASCVVGGLGYLGYTLAPTWWVVVLSRLAAGIGIASINPGINTYFAANESVGRMNWLHACFGLGATIGPVVMSSLLKAGFSWRWGYAIVVVAYVLLAACFGLTLRRWPQAVRSSDTASQATPKAQDRDTLRLPAVWLSLLLFFTFTGMEASSAQWSYALFTEGRGISAQTAGLWVSVYWASMTMGRVFFGIVADKVRVTWLARICMGSVLFGAVLIWSDTAPALAFLGLALAGFALSPLFPVLTSDTRNRLGSEHAANAIGYQITAVKLGLAAIPALGGVLSERLGVKSIGPFLFAISVAMLLLHEATERTRRRDAE